MNNKTPSVSNDYYEALSRLEKNKPRHLPKGTKISNDSVAIEAGRKKGCIKKSRPVFLHLIETIKTAKKAQLTNKNKFDAKYARQKAETVKYRQMWEEGLARELSLLQENYELKQRVESLEVIKVVQIKGEGK